MKFNVLRSLDWNSIGVFNFLEHEERVKRADGVNGTKRILNKFLVMVHVSRYNFQHIIVVTRNVVAFGNFINFRDGLGEIKHALARVLF